MAKKFGKFLLFTAAVGTAAAAVCYYMRKKDAALAVSDEDDDDYDDFSDDLEDDADIASRSYVPLNKNTAAEPAPQETQDVADGFTPLSEQAKSADAPSQDAAEAIEEFFDEEDEGRETL